MDLISTANSVGECSFECGAVLVWYRALSAAHCEKAVPGGSSERETMGTVENHLVKFLASVLLVGLIMSGDQRPNWLFMVSTRARFPLLIDNPGLLWYILTTK